MICNVFFIQRSPHIHGVGNNARVNFTRHKAGILLKVKCAESAHDEENEKGNSPKSNRLANKASQIEMQPACVPR
jgi:hypothetical protein